MVVAQQTCEKSRNLITELRDGVTRFSTSVTVFSLFYVNNCRPQCHLDVMAEAQKNCEKSKLAKLWTAFKGSDQ